MYHPVQFGCLFKAIFIFLNMDIDSHQIHLWIIFMESKISACTKMGFLAVSWSISDKYLFCWISCEQQYCTINGWTNIYFSASKLPNCPWFMSFHVKKKDNSQISFKKFPGRKLPKYLHFFTKVRPICQISYHQ